MVRTGAVVAWSVAALTAGAAAAGFVQLKEEPKSETSTSPSWEKDFIAPTAVAALGHAHAAAYLRGEPARAKLLAAAERASTSVVRVQCRWKDPVVESEEVGESGARRTTWTSHTSRGSGVVIGPRTVLTARHVLEESESSELAIVLSDGIHLPARVAAKGEDAEGEYACDWMLLDVAEDAPPLPTPLRIGKATWGASVVVIGFGAGVGLGQDGRPLWNDEGPSGSPLWTVGRVVRPEVMTIDVSAGGLPQQGTSGGPVIDDEGNVVGVHKGTTTHSDYDWETSHVSGRETLRTYKVDAAPSDRAAKVLASRPPAPR